MRVLLADDDRIIRHAVGAALAAAGHDTLEATDGEQVVELLEAEAPDVLLLDLMMPRMTGWEVLRWLHDRDPEGRVPVIVLSGFVADADEFRDHACVRAVLQKPLYIEDLLDALKRCALLMVTL